jgi:hypothetical protein
MELSGSHSFAPARASLRGRGFYAVADGDAFGCMRRASRC